MAEISYTKTNWVDNVTPLNAKNMNNIENGIEDANDAISAEVSARQAADTTLQSNITSEATTRQNTDTQLQGQITANYDELDGREEALNTRVTALEAIHTTYSDPDSDGNIVITSTDV